MAEVTLEQIQEALKKTGISTELDIKDLAKIAKAVKNGDIPKTENQKTKTIGTKWEVALQNYPDFVIKRTTPKTEQLLVIMPSCKGYYVKQKKGKNDEVVEELTQDLYVKFTSGMPIIDLDDNMWIKSLESGKRFYETFNIAIKDDNYVNMLKAHCAPRFETLAISTYSQCVNDSRVLAYNSYPTLFKEYHDSQMINERFLKNTELTKSLIEIFGLNNVRDYLNENTISLIGRGSQYNSNPLSNYRVKYLLKDYEFHYAEFKDYTLYHSVFMGYGRNMDRFWEDWYDDLNLQKQVYGKIKEKYPKDLPTHHMQMSYKSVLYRDIIDERKLDTVVKNLSKYDMEVDKYIFKCPKCKQDMLDEAQQQANCLAGYINKYVDGESEIFFMRKKSSPDESYITIEKYGDTLRQIYYARNRAVSREDRAIAEKWIKKCSRIDNKEE